LERELGERELADGAHVHEETRRLLEEAWHILTECLVIRDGLLQACQEIERTMSGVQSRLAAQDIPTAEPRAERRPAGNGNRVATGAPSTARDTSRLGSALVAARPSNGAANGSNATAANGSHGVGAH
jgi:hypothetical protein